VPLVTVAPTSQTLCLHEEVILTASGANTYTWLPNGENIPVLSDYPGVTTTYTIIGQSPNTCTTGVAVTIVVDECTGIQSSQPLSNGIHVFPNPSSGIITATFGFEGSKEIRIYTAVNSLVSVVSTTGNSETFDLTGMAKGVYFITISSRQASANYRIILTN
jgi:hypothetical protein